MSWRRARSSAADPDGQRVSSTAREIGWRVAVATAVLVVLGVVALFALIVIHARYDDDHGAPVAVGNLREIFRADLVVGPGDLLSAIVVVGAGAVLATGVIGWYAARRAVAPLEAALRLQRNFVADASHELRTPLTVLDGRVQTLRRRLARQQPVNELVDQLRIDSTVMRDVLDDLLLAAEQAETSSKVATDAGEVCRALVESLAGVVAESGFELSFRDDLAGGPLVVGVPEASLRRCVIALTDNAVQHTPPGGKVTVSVSQNRSWCEIRVSDTGHGIVGMPVEQVFERFAHSQDGRQRRSFGLGLALTRDVAMRAGGDATVESTSASGTVFRLRLPRVKTQA